MPYTAGPYIAGPFFPRRLRQVHRGTLVLAYAMCSATAGLVIGTIALAHAETLVPRWALAIIGAALLIAGLIGIPKGSHDYAHGVIESIEGSQPPRLPDQPRE